MTNPLDNEDLYDAIRLGNVRSPGRVTLSGHDRVIGWDVKKGAGQSGATTTRTSEDPTEFTAEFYLVRDDAMGIDQISAWPAFLDVIKSTVAGPVPKPLDIYHPDLAEVDIKSVVLKKIGGTRHDGRGGQIRSITFLEYRPPKPKGGTAKGSSAASSRPTRAPDPNAEALAELARLRQQYAATPWG